MADIIIASYSAAGTQRAGHTATSTAIVKHPENSGYYFAWLLLAFRLLLEIIYLKIEKFGLLEKIKKLEDENRKLYEKANLGSDTSGIPPSKDWKRQNGASKKNANSTNSDNTPKDNPPRETPSSVSKYLKNKDGVKRRPGGQPNHPSSFMRVTGYQEREPVLHYPGSCVCCSDFERCKENGKFRKYTTSHGYDVEIILVHREHQQFEATGCFRSGVPIRENFPEIIGAQYYETNIQLQILTWHHMFYGSYDRIALAAKELFGLSLSAGTANVMVKRISAKILGSGFMDVLRFHILNFEKVLGVDETGALVDGRNAWVHTAATANVTLLTAHWRRGYEGAIYSGLLQFYIHTLITDCWSAYFNAKLLCRHAICNGHILRELVAAAYFRYQGWAIEMFDLLLEIFENKRDAIERGEKVFQKTYIDDIQIKYKQIIKNGFAGIKETKGKTFSLLERLQKMEDAVLAFANDFNVEFTNNVSERSLRNLKTALHVAGQFKTMAGLGDYCIIQSFMDTCRKQGHNPYEMMRILMTGGDIIEAVFGEEKSVALKQMLRLSKAVPNATTEEVSYTFTTLGLNYSEEIYAAILHRPYKVCDTPPPEKKNSSEPLDKMNEARKQEELKKWSNQQQEKRRLASAANAGSG